MRDWRDLALHELASFEGLGIALTAGLLALSLVVLPKHDRRELRLPAGLLLTHIGIVFGHRLLDGPARLERPLAIVALLVLVLALSRVVFLLVVDWLIGKRLSRPMPRIFRDIIQILVYSLAGLVLLRALGFRLSSSLLTTSAVFTAIIGFSLQESLGNLMAGLAVQAERPFEVGDWIQVGDSNALVGSVVEINWRATKIRSADRVEIVVPNSHIAKSAVHNFTRPTTTTRRAIAFQAAYEVPPNQVRDVVADALRDCPGVLVEPPARVWTDGFGDSGVNYRAVFFISDFAAHLDTESDVRDRIWYALRRQHLTFPYPVRELRRASPVASEQLLKISQPERRALISGVELFDVVPPAELAVLAERAEAALYAADEGIVFEGDRADTLFILAAGEVAIEVQRSTGDRAVVARLGRGKLFGEFSLLTGTRVATVRAVIDSTVLCIRHRDFQEVVARIPGLTEKLLVRLEERQRATVRISSADGGLGDDRDSVDQAFFSRIRRFFSS